MSAVYKPTGSTRLIREQGRHRLFARDVTSGQGDIWHDGAMWVEGPLVNLRRKGSISKPFIGELAWADAERLFDDLVLDDARRLNR